MQIRPNRTDDDHREALRDIERLWDCAGDSPENDELDVLATLVEAYEAKRWPVKASSAAVILHYAVSEMGRSQAGLAAVLGSRSAASELMRGKRPFSLEAARKVSEAWGIPIELLVASGETRAA